MGYLFAQFLLLENTLMFPFFNVQELLMKLRLCDFSLSCVVLLLHKSREHPSPQRVLLNVATAPEHGEIQTAQFNIYY